MYKRKMWFGTAAIITMISVLLLRYTHAVGAKEAQRCVLYIRRDNGEVVFSLCAELQYDMPVCVDSWEKDGEYWLFLPAVFRGREVLFGQESLVLEEGSLVLSCEDGKEEKVHILFGSEIPCAWMNTESGMLQFLKESKENQERGSLCFVAADGTQEYAGELKKVKIRGNATRLQPKSPFRIRLDHSASLAGLGNSDDYVLLAEYGDISLMRNKLAMELAGQTTELYEPDGMYMDLYVNGEYMGVYLICEGISVGMNRLEITDLEAETDKINRKALKEYAAFQDVSGEDTMAKGYEIPRNPENIPGGYLLELEYRDRYEGQETTGFRTDRGRSLVIKEPSYASREQVDYIREQFQQVEDAMYAEDFHVWPEGPGLDEVADMESLVHKYLIDEICMNTDPWTSQFLYKDRDEEQFHFGPAWDYDMAFGHYDTGFSPEEFYVNHHIWYEPVYDDPIFQELLKEQYENDYLPVLKALVEQKIPEWKEILLDSACMNFVRWDIEEIYERNSIIHTGDSFEECVDELRSFIDIRTGFLTSQWLEKP